MRLAHFVIGVLIFGMFMIGWGGLINDLDETYGGTVDGTFTETFNRISTAANLSQRITDDVVGSEIDDAEPSQTLSTAMLSAAKLVLEIPAILWEFFEEIFDLLPIPVEMRGAILAIILVTISFLIMNAIFGWKVI